MIDSVEAARFGLKTEPPTAAQTMIMEKMLPYLNSLTVCGRLEKH